MSRELFPPQQKVFFSFSLFLKQEEIKFEKIVESKAHVLERCLNIYLHFSRSLFMFIQPVMNVFVCVFICGYTLYGSLFIFQMSEKKYKI